MSRSVYRETDTREWEEQPRRTYTTVKRYQVPEPSAARSSLGLGEEETKEKVVIRREKSAQPLRSEDDYRVSERYSSYDHKPRDDIDIRITERTRDREPRQEDDYRFTERIIERDREPRRDVTYRVVERENDYDDRRSSARGDYHSEYRSDYRVERDRETVRAPSPPSQDRVREFRFERERERDYSPPRHQHHDDSYEVERYSKDTEYYSPAPQPQPQPIIIRERAAPAPAPIIIREREPAPIIIREERREPQYEFIERREVDEEKQLVKREEPPPPAPQPQPQQQQQDEDYFYERRVREINREPRRRSDSHERRSEIRPKDSASNYSSDDSYEYVRKERTYEDDSHHKRHLAEGALAGAVGAQILRKHRNKEGKDGGGRVKSAVGGAAVGALGAEAISRFRSRSRRRGSRSRSRSSSFESKRDKRSRRGGRQRDRDRSRSRSRSRSKSVSRKQLAGLAGVAAVGALAGYALKNRGNKNETVIVNDGPPPRRSRSRRRRSSPDSYMMDEQMREDDKHRDPDHRNRRIAQAGLASAAAAGIWERVRSKSRGGKDRERSKSRIRTGVPIAAAGLGGAALAGLYEKNKASKEAKRDAIIADETSRGRRVRSRSRSRSVPARYPDDRRSIDDRAIAYGGEPIPPGAERGFYSDEDGPGTFNRRGRGGSSASSPDTRRRSRSRGRDLATAGAAAGIGAAAAHEYGKRNERKRNDRERQRREDERYDDRYGPSPGPYDEQPSGFLPPQQSPGYPPQAAYPASPFFQPPPTAAYEDAYAPAPGQAYPQQQQQQHPYPPYNPADYSQGAATPTPQQPQYPYDATRGVYGDSEANLGAPHGETYAGDPRYPAAAEEPPRDERRRGRDPNNVSAPTNGSAPVNDANANSSERENTQDADGLATPRARSTSRVRFDLGANEAHSPEASRQPAQERFSDSETSGDRKRRHRHSKRSSRHHRDRSRDRDSHHRDSPQLMNDKYERPPSSAASGSGGRRRDRDEEGSDGTVELPERFDEQGNRKPEGGAALEQLLGNLASRFLGGDDDEGRSGRRRSRH